MEPVSPLTTLLEAFDQVAKRAAAEEFFRMPLTSFLLMLA